MKNIAVFCASGKQYIEPFGHLVKELVRYCKKENIGVIYGGAKVGLMGLLADECIEERVPIIGIIPQGILDKELHVDNYHSIFIYQNIIVVSNMMVNNISNLKNFSEEKKGS